MNRTPYERVKLARSNKRPTGLDYIKNIFSDFIELHGDRRFGDDKAVVGGIARLGGNPVTVIAIERGIRPRIVPTAILGLQTRRVTARP